MAETVQVIKLELDHSKFNRSIEALKGKVQDLQKELNKLSAEPKNTSSSKSSQANINSTLRTAGAINSFTNATRLNTGPLGGIMRVLNATMLFNIFALRSNTKALEITRKKDTRDIFFKGKQDFGLSDADKAKKDLLETKKLDFGELLAGKEKEKDKVVSEALKFKSRRGAKAGQIQLDFNDTDESAKAAQKAIHDLSKEIKELESALKSATMEVDKNQKAVWLKARNDKEALSKMMVTSKVDQKGNITQQDPTGSPIKNFFRKRTRLSVDDEGNAIGAEHQESAASTFGKKAGTFALKASAAALFAVVLIGVQALTKGLQMLGNMLNTVANTIVSVVTQIAQTVKSLLEEGVKTFANFQRIELSFKAFDIKKAKELFQWIKDFATQSVLDFEDLAQITPQLAAANIPIKSSLKAIADIAAPFGKEKIQELGDALVRARGERNFGRVMQTLGSMGINANDFEKQGLKFNDQGRAQFDDPSMKFEQFFDAFLKVAKIKFGKVGEELENSLTVSLSNLGDKWKQVWSTFGEGIAPVLTEILNHIRGILGIFDFKDAGKRLGESLKKFLFAPLPADLLNMVKSPLQGKDISKSASVFDVLVGIASYIAAIITTLPELLGILIQVANGVVIAFSERFNAIVPVLAQGFNEIIDLVTGAIYVLATGFMILTSLLKGILEGVTLGFVDTSNIDKMNYSILTFLQDLRVWGDKLKITDINDPMKSIKGTAGRFISELNPVLSKIQQRHDEYMGKYQNYVPGANKGLDMTELNPLISEASTHTGILGKIEENTDKLPEFTRYALGGGDLAKIGITPVESYGIRRKSGGNSNWVATSSNELTRAIETALHRLLSDYQLQGEEYTPGFPYRGQQGA